MFNKEQINFMKSIGFNCDFKNLTDDDKTDIEEKISDYLMLNGIDTDNTLNEIGIMCESIIDLIINDEE